MQKRNEFFSRYDISGLFLDDYDYIGRFVSPLEDDEKVPPMPPLEGDEEEVKIAFLLYQHCKVIKTLYNDLINSS